MKKIILKTIIIGSVSLYKVTASSASWSYLYCINSNSLVGISSKEYCGMRGCLSKNWVYAKRDKSSVLNPYQDFMGSFLGGTYILSREIKKNVTKIPLWNGFSEKYDGLKIEKFEYAVVNHEFQNEKEAEQFCEVIQEKCRQDSIEIGSNYTSVGYGGEAQPWRGIRAEFPGGGKNCKTLFPSSYTTVTWGSNSNEN